MKLKFRADAKDIIIFIIFCFVLLYLVAIAVLNLVEFASSNTFYGLDPIEAFSPKYIQPTLIFFLLALVMVITSVSSYFFEMEKGFGVVAGKADPKGYARWAKEKEIKQKLDLVIPNAETAEHAGVVLMNNGKELWVDDSENHTLVIGSTGSGKTQLVVLPLVKVLAKKGESMIITDPKGEIYRDNAQMLRDKGYNVIILNFRDPEQGTAWNPLMLPYELHKSGNHDKAIELLEDLAINILYDEKAQNQDPFWEKTSADYFVGLALALFEDAPESEINLNSINVMSTVGEEKYRGTNYLKEYFSDKDQSSPMYINVASALMAPSDTKGSILSVFKQKIKLFSSREKISEMLSHSDFDMKSIGRSKTAVFVVVQDEKKTYHPLVTTFIKQVYETLIDVAQENGGKLKYRTNFILDEFANMPPLKDITTMITASRSRLIRMTLIIQNFAQLYQVYGKENGETIKGNCGNIIYLISTELSALEELSKLAGEVKSKDKDKTSSTPLVTISDLQRLKLGEVIIFRLRAWPLKTKLVFNYKMNWGRQYPVAEFLTRELRQVEIFDLKKYVDERNKEKTNNLFGDMNPNMMPFGPSMFGNNNPYNPAPTTQNEQQTKPQETNFDVDDFVKRIDAKIAQLEEEERLEKEQADKDAAKKIQPIDEEVVGTPITEIVAPKTEEKPPVKIDTPSFDTIEEEVKEINKPIAEVPVKVETSVEPSNDKVVTDDQFFDDFFNEE